jgi:hypothetical protein
MIIKSKLHIPESREDMEKLKEGDLVPIITGDYPEDTFRAVLDKFEDGWDFFIAQGELFGKDTISQYAQKRTEHKYDEQRGIILAGTYGFNHYHPKDWCYSEKLVKLRAAGLWQETAGVRV